jgi:hypothetical protein
MSMSSQSTSQLKSIDLNLARGKKCTNKALEGVGLISLIVKARLDFQSMIPSRRPNAPETEKEIGAHMPLTTRMFYQQPKMMLLLMVLSRKAQRNLI